MEKIKDFNHFYEFYLTQHSHPICRLLHVVGTLIGCTWFFVTLLFGKPYLTPLFLVWGYGISWIGHFFLEKNKPAAFKQPIFSFMGDFKMCFEVISLQRGLKDK